MILSTVESRESAVEMQIILHQNEKGGKSYRGGGAKSEDLKVRPPFSRAWTSVTKGPKVSRSKSRDGAMADYPVLFLEGEAI